MKRAVVVALLALACSHGAVIDDPIVSMSTGRGACPRDCQRGEACSEATHRCEVLPCRGECPAQRCDAMDTCRPASWDGGF